MIKITKHFLLSISLTSLMAISFSFAGCSKEDSRNTSQESISQNKVETPIGNPESKSSKTQDSYTVSSFGSDSTLSFTKDSLSLKSEDKTYTYSYEDIKIIKYNGEASHCINIISPNEIIYVSGLFQDSIRALETHIEIKDVSKDLNNPLSVYIESEYISEDGLLNLLPEGIEISSKKESRFFTYREISVTKTLGESSFHLTINSEDNTYTIKGVFSDTIELLENFINIE